MFKQRKLYLKIQKFPYYKKVNLKEDHYQMVDKVADEICKKFDKLLGKP